METLEMTDRELLRIARKAGDFLGTDATLIRGNVLGVIEAAIDYAPKLREELGRARDEVDAIVGKPLGHPKTAAFATADLVGLDTLTRQSGTDAVGSKGITIGGIVPGGR